MKRREKRKKKKKRRHRSYGMSSHAALNVRMDMEGEDEDHMEMQRVADEFRHESARKRKRGHRFDKNRQVRATDEWSDGDGVPSDEE